VLIELLTSLVSVFKGSARKRSSENESDLNPETGVPPWSPVVLRIGSAPVASPTVVSVPSAALMLLTVQVLLLPLLSVPSAALLLLSANFK